MDRATTPAGRRERRPWGPYALVALAAWLLAAPLWIVLLVRAGPPDLEWTRAPYVDRRWLLALYWLSVGAVLAVPWIAYGIHRVAAAAPTTARGLVAALRGPAADPPEAGRRATAPSVRAAVFRGACGLLVATAMFGPPWHAGRVAQPIDFHETLHWSGLQAIAEGWPPYLGPASINYGPGIQLLTYGWMTTAGKFTVPGFRASFGLSLWIAAGVLLALAFALLRPPAALLTAALLPLLSPAALWGWEEDGVLRGFWGWGNALRMIGPPALALAAVAAAGLRPGRSRDLGGGFALGLLWGLFAYLAQENLVAGGATLALLFPLLLVTGTLPLDRLAGLAAGLAGGFAAVWAPIAVCYGRLGRLGEFWHNYALVPGRFLRGYNNIAYDGSPGEDPFAVAFHVTPFLAVLLALAVLVRARPRRFALQFVAPLDRDRLLVLAPCVALLASYPAALTRSDAQHFLATLSALPVAVGAALFHLPRCFATPAARWRARLAVVALAGLAFWPTWRQAPGELASFVRGRTRALTAAPGAAWTPGDEVARRFGPALSRSPVHRPHVELMRRIHEVAGDGSVFVLISERHRRVKGPAFYYAGVFYFLADLRPGPIQLDRSGDMVADSEQIRRFQRHFREHVGRFDFVVSLVPSSAEIRIFQQANPGFTTTEVEAGGVRVWIYGRGPVTDTGRVRRDPAR